MSPELRTLLLSSLAVYGLPLLFGTMVIAGTGLPLPIVLMLLTAGALAQQKLLALPNVISVAILAAVVGDHLGYAVGRWGGRPLFMRLHRNEALLQRALDAMERRGWWAIFLSRCIFTILGSPCNWACGILGYPLLQFFTAELLGKAIYITVVVALGYIFVDRLEAVSQAISSFSLWLLALGVIGVALRWLWQMWLKQKLWPSVRSPL
jgi:membrane protein DedA with SNARE-associated domain